MPMQFNHSKVAIIILYSNIDKNLPHSYEPDAHTLCLHISAITI